MIIQTVLNWYVDLLVGVISLVPPLPTEVETALRSMANAGTLIGPKIAALGVVVPFDVVNNCINLWVGMVVWWFSMILLRVVIWAAGR